MNPRWMVVARMLAPAVILAGLGLRWEAKATDVGGFAVLKGQHFTQLPIAGMDPVPDSQGHLWRAEVRAAEGGRLLAASVQPPTGGERGLVARGADWVLQEAFGVASDREAAFPDGKYAFRIGGETDGTRAVTLSLVSGSLPRRATFREPDTLLALNGRTDLALSWDLGDDGTEPTFVQVVVVDLLGEVVFRSPDPGQPGALSGEGTRAMVPSSTWRARPGSGGGPGLYQVQLTTYGALTLVPDLYPGAVGFSGTYRMTAITAMVTEVPTCGDVESFEVLRGRLWRQSAPEVLEPLAEGSHVFEAEVRECLAGGLVRARWIGPGGVVAALSTQGAGRLGFREAQDSAVALSARFPAGDYGGEIEGKEAGVRSMTLTVGAGELKPVRVANWDTLQSPDYSEPVTIRLASDLERRKGDDLQLLIVDGEGRSVYETPGWWVEEARIPGDSATLTVPRGVLGSGQVYEARVRMLRRDEVDTTGFPGAAGLGGIFSETRFPIGSLNPEVIGARFEILNASELRELPLGVGVDFVFEARAGVPPVLWEMVNGALPDGVRLDSESGDLLGFPSREGLFSFGIQARDASTNEVTRLFTVRVAGPPAPLRIATTGLPVGTGGLRYCGALSASGGVRPYGWKLGLGSGRLPRGLELDAEAGLIIGIPEESGSFPLRVVASDEAGQSGEVIVDLVIPPYTPAAPLRIAGYRRLGDRHALRLQDAEVGSYLVEASTDLLSWVPIAATQQVPEGDWVFTDPGEGGRRFFRVRLGAIGPDAGSVNVHATLDPGWATRALLPGGENRLVLTNRQGVVFELSLPAESLREPTEIRMTAVESIPDLPTSGGLLGAVSLEPEGLVLQRPGTLTIRFPGGAPAGVTAFSAQGMGLDCHLVGHRPSEGGVVIPVRHFTLFGTGTETQRKAASMAGCSLESWVSENVERMAMLPGAEDHELLVFLFTTWFDVDRGVRPTLMKAVNNEKQLLNAKREFTAWVDLLNQTAGDARLRVAGADRLSVEMAGRIKAGQVLLGKAFQSAFQEVEARCIQNKAVRDAFRLRAEVDMAKEAVADGLCPPIFDWAQLEQRLVDLLRCEFSMRSTTQSKGSSASSVVQATTGERGELTWDPGLGYWIGDKSRFGLASWRYHDDSATTVRTEAADRGGVAVHEAHIGWRAENRQVTDGGGCSQLETVLVLGDIRVEFNARLDVDLWLLPKKGPPNNTHDDFWRGPFVIAMLPHQIESGYRLDRNWSWTAIGERFARWSQSTAEGRISVSTTVDLYYAPGK